MVKLELPLCIMEQNQILRQMKRDFMRIEGQP